MVRFDFEKFAAAMFGAVWATKYVLIATPTICLSLFECDA